MRQVVVEHQVELKLKFVPMTSGFSFTVPVVFVHSKMLKRNLLFFVPFSPLKHTV
jgi:hypothetical protein